MKLSDLEQQLGRSVYPLDMKGFGQALSTSSFPAAAAPR
jgi:hypothetical protein